MKLINLSVLFLAIASVHSKHGRSGHRGSHSSNSDCRDGSHDGIGTVRREYLLKIGANGDPLEIGTGGGGYLLKVDPNGEPLKIGTDGGKFLLKKGSSGGSVGIGNDGQEYLLDDGLIKDSDDDVYSSYLEPEGKRKPVSAVLVSDSIPPVYAKSAESARKKKFLVSEPLPSVYASWVEPADGKKSSSRVRSRKTIPLGGNNKLKKIF
ncbi:uncharacterized protein [Fopius arisanus]|uniref:Uncharacterized protein n=1 Tax=Fopius arisanus TaxID=64838 RepID=A0A9R1TJB7_9HYME|nr:PREDICTED: uncharacterized protein LOC105270641 [Fopius arisanus]